MGLDHLRVLTVGTLVPKEGGPTWCLITLLAITPRLGGHCSWVAPQRSLH